MSSYIALAPLQRLLATRPLPVLPRPVPPPLALSLALVQILALHPLQQPSLGLKRPLALMCRPTVQASEQRARSKAAPAACVCDQLNQAHFSQHPSDVRCTVTFVCETVSPRQPLLVTAPTP